MNETILRLKGEQLIPAIAYGDAAGLPVETRSAEYIEERYGRIESLIETADNPYFTGTHNPGYWSDDTQLSIAVAEGLISAGHFNIDAIAAAHITAYDATPEITNKRGEQVKRGWGGSTVQAMERIKSGISPLHSGTKNGPGNGVLMKMAPLVFWQVARMTTEEERHQQYDQLTTMTHDSDIARMTTRIHGDVLYSLLLHERTAPKLVEIVRRSAEYHEYALGSEDEIPSLLRYLQPDLSHNAILQNTDGRGFYSPQTLAMAYGAYIVGDGDIAPSVYTAVNLGGDTDSTASIVAAMSTFAKGEISALPDDYEKLDQLAMLQRVSKELAQAALK
jgi:ADP-ribosylglycohydrolase